MKFEEFYKLKESNQIEHILRVFGVGMNAKGKIFAKTSKTSSKTHRCPECGKSNCVVHEEHPDTDMNEMILKCPDCGYSKEI